jgi:hypothetical protein
MQIIIKMKYISSMDNDNAQGTSPALNAEATPFAPGAGQLQYALT